MAVTLPRRAAAATGRQVLRGARAGVVAMLGFAIGVGLAAVGAKFGPLFIALVPLCFLLGIGILMRPNVAVMAVFASLPVGFITIPTVAYDVKLIEVVVLGVAIIVVLRRLGTTSAPLGWAHQLWPALFFVTWALVATPSSVNRLDAYKQDAVLVLGLLLVSTVLAACRSMREVRNAVLVLLAVGAVMSAIGLQGVSRLQARFGGAVGVNRAQGVFAQPNDLGTFAAVLLMVSLGAVLGARERRSQLLGAACGVLSLLALLFSLSRGAWIGTTLAGIFMLLVLPQARRALMMVVPLLILTGGLFAIFLPTSPPQVEVVRERLSTFTHPEDNPYDARPAIYHEALREIREDPWTGQGPGNFPDASALSASLSQSVGAIHAHNTLLTVAAETGLPNVALLLIFTLAVGMLAIRAARTLPHIADRALVAGLAAALVVQMGQGTVDFNLRNPVLFMLMAGLTGLVLVAGREAREARKAREAESAELEAASPDRSFAG